MYQKKGTISEKVSQDGDCILLDPMYFHSPIGHGRVNIDKFKFKPRHDHYELFCSLEVK